MEPAPTTPSFAMRRAPVEDPAFAHVLGLFKVAVIAQQIYARYVSGHTKDPRFAQLDQVVAVIGDVAEQALSRA
jgi:aminoglycoside phosphotransferase (APT) family kinase protein